ncbi:RDD family protein [Flavobacterium circumlabens]|uniref:RDD family membrane protein YckC n=1 Tax=Flavobacterium circumlabens TaxID=2133765 RepID=A0A4Y7UCB8_9FLAO|nr:RDD family protein [Flavobacterium circumlabens]TCN57552.1 putative RDD family membrane protein YckC [Flavobacterium circumlabens]TEB43861.1 RDD family protein [Flavobacterium circumlabens]
MNQEKIATKPNLKKRIGAGLIDYSLMFGMTLVMFLYFGEKTSTGYGLHGFPALANTLMWCAYMIGFELKFGGTLGNLVFDLQVISIKDSNTTSLTLGQSFKRHLLDMLDLWFFGLLGILLIKNTKYNQRLGDIWAKTIVIDSKDSTQFCKRFV